MDKQFRAILFDMDGTLIDSMTYHVIAWKKAFEEAGFQTDDLVFYLNEGVRHPVTVRERLAELGIHEPKEELIRKIFTRKRQIFEQIVEINPVPGVMELLDFLKGKIKLGVVTGGVRNVVEMVISRLFDGYFDIVVDYDSTERGKPDPEPFEYGARLTGLPKANILAVENAPTGIKSARAAELTCWAVCTTLRPEYLSDAHRVFKDFIELKDALLSE